MSGFNMLPGVGVHDIPGNELEPSEAERIEDLQREIENLLRDAQRDGEIIERQCARAEKAERELAEAKRDSARLDWLQKRGPWDSWNRADEEGVYLLNPIRDSIDAAMEAST